MQSILTTALRTTLAALILTLSGQAVLAQQEPDQVVYQKRTVIDFSDVTVQGELTRPEGAYLLNRKKTNFSNMLRYRGSFIPELLYSTDNL